MAVKRILFKFSETLLMIAILVFISVVLFIYRNRIRSSILDIPFPPLALFILSFVSCISLIPIPYTYIVFLMAATMKLSFIAALTAGLGSALGEAVAWLLGRGARSLIGDSVYVRRYDTLLRYLEKRGSWLVPLFAFIFALTPLPDKLLYLPLGILRYSLWRILPFTILGKVAMNYVIIVAGAFFGTIVKERLGGVYDEILFIITTVLLIAIMALFTFIEWEEILLKYVSNEK